MHVPYTKHRYIDYNNIDKIITGEREHGNAISISYKMLSRIVGILLLLSTISLSEMNIPEHYENKY